MKGEHRVIVSAKRLRYDFVLRRNSVELVCDKACYVLSGALWKEQLSGIQDGIVFIDEGNEFIRSDDFAREIRATDNYYVIVSRESIPALPYSVEEIYGIRSSGKYGTLKQRYHEFYRIYGQNVSKNDIRPEVVVTEDSNSGYRFFEAVCNAGNLACYSAGGKSNIFHYLKINRKEKILVIADGAAFGPEIDRVLRLLAERENAALYLPESFEWLVLSSVFWKDRETADILRRPSDYIESRDYFSWEQFFTAVLTEKSRDTYLAYSKRILNQAYLEENIKAAILKQMEKIILNREDLGDVEGHR